MTRFFLFNAFFLLFIAFTPSCVKLKAEPANIDTVHVIVLGFDGWGASSFNDADMPFLKSIISESAWTMHKRSILPSSSACNWATMFKGVGPEAHGYIDWNTTSPAFDVTYKNENGFFPSLFSVYRNLHPNSEIGYFYQWEGMGHLFDKNDFSHSYQFPLSETGSNQMRNTAIAYILNYKPSLAAFIWDYPDKVGHSIGWYTEEYMSELSIIDTIIEDIVRACINADIYDNTLFVIVSDHGGHDKTHGQPLMSDIETPFIAFGPGIKPGEISEPLMQYDVAAFLADYLHIPQPSAWRGRSPEGIFK